MRQLILIAVSALAFAGGFGSVAAAQNVPSIILGYAKCAHCTPMSLTPQYATGVKIDAVGFNTGNDALTALVSKNIDVAQVTYLHYAVALDKGLELIPLVRTESPRR